MNDAQLESSRTAFEAWLKPTSGWKACAQRGKPMSLRTHINGHYADFRVNDRWLAWQAARSVKAARSTPVNLTREELLAEAIRIQRENGWDVIQSRTATIPVSVLQRLERFNHFPPYEGSQWIDAGSLDKIIEVWS